ncbi:MAG: type IX secretion system PorP/SprF family membrane protein [Ancylomarina sp.]|jgi:type IX secretion system PorP/SprF family membrane protein
MRKYYISTILFQFITISFVMLSCFIFKAQAQQVSLTDQYYINPSLHNPAAVGYNNLLEAYLIRNEKFRDFDGGNIFHAFTLGAGLKDGKYGIGINLTNNNIDIFNRTEADFAYSYRIKINDQQLLRLGLSAGISDFRLNLNKTNADMNDELLQASHYNNTEFSASIGAFYTNKKLTLGFAIPQIISRSKLTKYDGDDLYRQSRHFLLSGSYEIPILSIKDLSFVPNFMMRYVKNTPLQYDVNALLKLKNKGWFSVNYKNKYAIGLNIGVHALKNFKVGYSYNVNTQNTAHISSNNQEFLIGYSFRKKTNRDKNVQSDELKYLKDILEDKYNKINQLEKELETYAEESRIDDRDRDGILDEYDICPNTPPFYKVDERGCSLDTDGDGIVDSEDMCPEKAGTINNNGCPDFIEKQIVLDEKLQNLFFEFGQASLTDLSKEKVDKVIVILRENEDYVLKLHGHTDDIGSAKLNRELAYKRLNTIHDYLIHNSIPESRIVILPHGENSPLVENTNAKSRAFNRRVYLEMFSYEEYIDAD